MLRGANGRYRPSGTRTGRTLLSEGKNSGQAVALAQLGLFALKEPKPNAVMTEVIRVIAEFLDVELSAVLEVAPSGDRFVRRVWHGFREKAPPALLSGEAGLGKYTLAVNRSVVVDDLSSETRFQCSALAKEGVISGLCVIVRGPAEHVDVRYGTLFAGSRSRHVFDSDAIEFVEAVSGVLGLVIYRRRTEEQLRKSEERFVLLADSIRDGALVPLGAEGSIAGWSSYGRHSKPVGQPDWGKHETGHTPNSGVTCAHNESRQQSASVTQLLVQIMGTLVDRGHRHTLLRWPRTRSSRHSSGRGNRSARSHRRPCRSSRRPLPLRRFAAPRTR